jgi:hypothetical protein
MDATEDGEMRAVLGQAWQRAGEIVTKRGGVAMSAEGMDVERIVGAHPRLVLVTFPPPLAAPEPYFAAITTAPGNGANSKKPIVFTLEMSNPGDDVPVLGRIDPGGMHAMLQSFAFNDRASFLRAIQELLAGSRPHEARRDVSALAHCMLYAMADSAPK